MKKRNNKKDIENFISILEKRNKINKEINSFNIVLNGRWGDGKTTFFNEVKEYIKNIESTTKLYKGIRMQEIIEISAWDYDFLDDPSEMIYDIFKSNNNDVLSKIGNAIKIFLSGMSKEIISDLESKNKFFKYASAGFKNVKNENKIEENNNQEKVENLLKFIDLKNIIKSSLKNNEEKIYIFIDDLDRCNPNFVIKLIELTKHIFDIKNITIIYMLDWMSTNESIMNHYGLKIKENYNELYLTKIMDYIYDLPKKDKIEYLFEKYFNKHTLGEYSNNSQISSMEMEDNYMNQNSLVDDLTLILDDITFRSAEVYFEHLYFFYEKNFSDKVNILHFSEIIVFFTLFYCSKRNIGNSEHINERKKKISQKGAWNAKTLPFLIEMCSKNKYSYKGYMMTDNSIKVLPDIEEEQSPSYFIKINPYDGVGPTTFDFIEFTFDKFII